MPQSTPNVFTYPRQEPGTLGHLDLVEPLRSLPRDVAGELKGLLAAQLTFRADDDGWCIQEVVGHLADAAEVYHKRIYMMSTQTDPILEPYDPDAFAGDHAYLERSIEDLLDRLRYWRGETVQLLTTLVNWNWARTGRHLESGRLSIRQIVEHMVEHEADHLATIRALRAAAPKPNT
ncbi:MAG: DinB family protein [Chloroflexi bacterium]|nr:DinB family protein [Chloroflexota bacterium]